MCLCVCVCVCIYAQLQISGATKPDGSEYTGLVGVYTRTQDIVNFRSVYVKLGKPSTGMWLYTTQGVYDHSPLGAREAQGLLQREAGVWCLLPVVLNAVPIFSYPMQPPLPEG
jgi:hypothetical protein